MAIKGSTIALKVVIFVLIAIIASALVTIIAYEAGGFRSKGHAICSMGIDEDKARAFQAGDDPMVEVTKLEGETRFDYRHSWGICETRCQASLTQEGFLGHLKHRCLFVLDTNTSFEIGY